MTFVGIRYRITSVIRTHGVIVIRIEDRPTAVVAVVEATPGIIHGRVVAVARTIIRGAAMVIREAIGIHGGAMASAMTRRGAV
jgi:hypothetical protein